MLAERGLLAVREARGLRLKWSRRAPTRYVDHFRIRQPGETSDPAGLRLFLRVRRRDVAKCASRGLHFTIVFALFAYRVVS